MKKFIILILFTICFVFGISAFAACGNSGDGKNGNNVPTENQYNENITYKLSYTSEEECPNGNIFDNKLHSSLNFEVDKTYYMVMDFKISSFERSAWGGSFNSTVKIFPLETISATLEEAATGNMSEKTENGGTIITTTYSIPENRGEEKTYRVTFQMKIRSEGLINIGILFYGDNENAENAHLDEISIGLNVTAGLNYALNSDGKSYSVSNIGEAKDNEIKIPTLNWGLPVTSIESNAFYNCIRLTGVIIPNSVTSIGGDAFYGCTSLTIISIPDSVKSIGDSAFGRTILTNIYIKDIASWCNIDFGSYDANPLSYAHNLYLNGQLVTNLDIPFGVTTIKQFAFEGCPNLESITLTDSVTSIGNWAFEGCKSLTSITIPKSVTSIGKKAFSDCSRLANITIPDNVTSIGDSAFKDCTAEVKWGDNPSIKEIGESAFYGYKGTSISIPDSVKSIGDHAFSDCSRLASITIPDSVTSIGQEAFYGCASLTSVTIPDSVKSIGDHAFSDCSRLASITIPDSVTSIGQEAFYGCTSLKSISVAEGNIAYSSQDGVLFNKNKTALIRVPQTKTNVTIPDSVTSLGNFAFSGCTKIKTVSAPTNAIGYIPKDNLNTVIITSGKSIGERAFDSCTNLTSVTIPDSVTSIGSSAFGGCRSLTSITIGNNVTSIGKNAFQYCTNLKGIYINNIAAWCNIDFDNTAYSNPLYYAHNLYLKGQLVTNLDMLDGIATIKDYTFKGFGGTSITIPTSVTSIGDSAFYGCTSLKSVSIPDSVTSIGIWAFYDCTNLKSVKFENPNGWYCTESSSATSGTDIPSSSLQNPVTAATYLKDTYNNYYWKRK